MGSAADFERRLAERRDELKWLYMELYDNFDRYQELEDSMRSFYEEREDHLKKRDLVCEANPDWYKSNDVLGMMLYIDQFAGNMKGVKEKLSYLEDAGVTYIHLMPFLDTTDGKSDGGYAVKDFRKVKPELGTMEDLRDLTKEAGKKDIHVCMDFVLNHTCEDHEWAVKARQGDPEYQDRYFFFDDYSIPAEYEKTVPQVFPTTAPGNFTYLPELNKHVMTCFYPYQWDLDYRNPIVFNEMMYNFLFLANQGIDIIRLDAVPYIWKELGTTCRNLPQVHTLVRMMRLIGEVVCPAVILLGEVVMEPSLVVPYFGTVEKPECHMLYNVTTMATIWHTVATREVSLLKKQLDIVNALPKDYLFLNYLRCHDDIGWGLDYKTLAMEQKYEVPHKNYLNAYFLGKEGGSNSRGALYNYDPVTQDGRMCGTCASLCGIEKALEENDKEALAKAIDLHVMLHACMFMQTGIPVLYAGDEMGQTNDNDYVNDPLKVEDSRYIHRGKMRWDLVPRIEDPETMESQVFNRLRAIENIRKGEPVFGADADTWTVETWDPSVLCIGRWREGEKVFGVFNFSEFEKTAWLHEEGQFRDMESGEELGADSVVLPPYGYRLLKQ